MLLPCIFACVAYSKAPASQPASQRIVVVGRCVVDDVRIARLLATMTTTTTTSSVFVMHALCIVCCECVAGFMGGKCVEEYRVRGWLGGGAEHANTNTNTILYIPEHHYTSCYGVYNCAGREWVLLA